ncbi:beta-lactamase family protein [Streptomyces kunmingensis]|uniref:Beta-lactamase family protein n=1 Tax=Streptomyces kunmingensis TaxID=68225 RepID=A0ABU6C8H9_9ACTN|nr:serine hydrolase domain-containing protein [Streptomyces kunmingensis]MEB3961031.1 beta-lactamase family protein [Streptomyces kunmingensis]
MPGVPGRQVPAAPQPPWLPSVPGLTALLSAAPAASAVAVGLHRHGQRALLVHGTTAHVRHGGVPADEATRFEIGSLTKTFTALLLAEQAARGELDLRDPLARHLPPTTRLPPGGAAITLAHLATHTSGLPRLPPGLMRTAVPRLFTNPYAAFSTADTLHALSRTRLRSRPGTRVHYSNFGVGLLGHALCAAAGTRDYASLLNARILRPLGLHDTDCGGATPLGAPSDGTPPDDAHPAGATHAIGYWNDRPRPPFHIPGMPAAGAVRSSVRDLLTFTEALLDPSHPASGHAVVPLRAALADTVRPRLALRRGTQQTALIWNIRPRRDGSRLYHHSGGTRGCTAFAGFDPRRQVAVVALANCAPGPGNHLIQQAYDTLVGLGAQEEASA